MVERATLRSSSSIFIAIKSVFQDVQRLELFAGSASDRQRDTPRRRRLPLSSGFQQRAVSQLQVPPHRHRSVVCLIFSSSTSQFISQPLCYDNMRKTHSVCIDLYVPTRVFRQLYDHLFNIQDLSLFLLVFKQSFLSGSVILFFFLCLHWLVDLVDWHTSKDLQMETDRSQDFEKT